MQNEEKFRAPLVSSVVRGALMAFAVASVLGGVGAPAHAQSASRLNEEAQALQGRLSRLRDVYLQPTQLDDPMTMATRLADGQARYMVGEYEAAAIILIGIVESDSYRGMPGYNDARYWLAESLFEMRNFVMARGYFEDIVESSDSSHRMDAASRLLEVSFEMDRYDGLDELYSNLQSSGGANGPEIAYVRGKAMYFQGAYDRALSTLGGIAPGNGVHARAQYFVGAIYARQGDYDASVAAFDGVLAEASSIHEPWAEELVELARLGRGRVFYEQERWDEASFAYGEVSRESSQFERALYEYSWTLIREDRYADAIRNLEILQTIADRQNVRAEANLLRGDLLMRLGRYEEAVQLFEGVADLYNPVEQELTEMLEGLHTVEAFFDAALDPRTGALRLPEVATQWVDTDVIVQRSIELSYDVATLTDAISESRVIVDELETALTSDSGVGIFPSLREGWGNALELQNDATLLRAEVVDYERQVLWPTMSSDERARFAELERRGDQAEGDFRAMPLTYDELDTRQQQTTQVLEEMVLDVYRSEQDIELARSQVASMRALLAEQVRRGERSQEEAASLNQEFRTVDAELEQQLEAARLLQREVERNQAGVGVSDQSVGPESGVRNAYASAIQAEHAYLQSLRGGAVGELATVDATLAILDDVDAGVAASYRDFSSLAQGETQQYVEILNDERAALRGYERLLEGYRTQSTSLTGEVMYAAFLDVQHELSGITLRANLGIIDVAWRQKEEVTDEISGLFEARNRSLRILDADFAELLLEE